MTLNLLQLVSLPNTWTITTVIICFTVTTVSVVLVSVLVLVISTAIITSIIVWCVMRRRPSSHATATTSTTGTSADPVIYDIPNAVKKHTITTQDNVAYGGTIPLKHNEAYQQVNIN